MYWIDIDEKFLDYMREYEQRIPYTDYGAEAHKPFFGVLFENDNYCYVTNITHPKERHLKMKNMLDFKKIYDKHDRFVGVVNLNYMFPIPKSMVNKLEYKDIDKHRSFSDDTERSKYIYLLKEEIRAINKSHDMKSDAIKLYNMKYNNPEHKISKRCLDFKQLESIASNY